MTEPHSDKEVVPIEAMTTEPIEVRKVNVSVGVDGWITLPRTLIDEMGWTYQFEMRILKNEKGEIVSVILNKTSD